MSTRILIVEDEAPAAKRLAGLIKEIEPNAILLDVMDSIESTVKWLSTNDSPDLLFLDIHLADGNSFLLFEQTTIECPIIFATAYDEYALRAFRVNSIDYLLKPIEKEDLKRALNKFKHVSNPAVVAMDIKSMLAAIKSDTRTYKQRFLVRVADRLVPVNTQDIHYFVADEKLVYLQTPTHKYPVDFTLDQLEDILDPKLFFRLNRKFIGQLCSIQKIHNHLNGKLKITLSPAYPEELYVSREKAGEFKEWLEG